jgi:hypothetical protein
MIWWQAELVARGIGARDHPMKGHGYNSAELQSFYGVLDRMVTEVAERGLEIPVYVMIQRLFESADHGERDPERLRLAILCDADARRSKAA